MSCASRWQFTISRRFITRELAEGWARAQRADTDGGFPLYVCVEHGWFVIGGDGRLQDLPHPPERSH